MNTNIHKAVFIMLLSGMCAGSAHAAIAVTGLETVYSQDFNTLPSSGTNLTWVNNSTVPGWYRNYGGSIAEPARDVSVQAEDVNGSGVVGQSGFINAGLNGKPDRSVVLRALYTKQSATGVVLQNRSGKTAAGFSAGYTGEQWRRATAAASSLYFEYAVVPSVSEARLDIQAGNLPWIRVDALEFTSPEVGASSGLNGTKKIFQKVIKPATVNVQIADGDYLVVRWLMDDPVNHHALGIDDVQITLKQAAE